MNRSLEHDRKRMLAFAEQSLAWSEGQFAK
jgi:hypothetical protein